MLKSVSARAGTTFLEVMLSVALLAVVATMIMTAIGNMFTAQIQERQTLAAAELSNRLMLQYLHDKRTLPQAGLPVEYGANRFRWELTERSVKLEFARQEALSARAQNSAGLTGIKAVTFRVWLSEESGGSSFYEDGAPRFMLSRIVNPVALRNPDSIDHMLKDPDLYREFIQNFTGANTLTPPTGTAGQGTGSGGRGATPRTNTPASRNPGNANPGQGGK